MNNNIFFNICDQASNHIHTINVVSIKFHFHSRAKKWVVITTRQYVHKYTPYILHFICADIMLKKYFMQWPFIHEWKPTIEVTVNKWINELLFNGQKSDSLDYHLCH